MMKKISILLAIAICIIAFASCGKGEDKKDNTQLDAQNSGYQLFNEVAPDELKAIDDFKIFTSEKFFFTAIAESQGLTIEISLLREGNKVSTISSMDMFGKTIKTLQKGKYMYTIITQDKKYSKEETGEDESVLGFSFNKLKFSDTEEKEIDGKASKIYNFSYVPVGSADNKEEKFGICIADGKILAFIIMGETVVLEEFSATAPAGTFDIPQDYTEVSSDDLSELFFTE